MTSFPTATLGFGGYILSVPTIQSLRNTPAKVARRRGDFVFVCGTFELGDGAGGVYCWVPTSLENDDGQIVIKPFDLDNSVPGRWRWSVRGDSAVYEQYLSIESQITDPDYGLLRLKALIENEVTTRLQGDTALIDELHTLETTVTGNLVSTDAKISDESQTRASADSALASRTSALEASINDPSTGLAKANAKISDESTARANADNALASRTTTLEAQMAGSAGSQLSALISSESTARANADQALSQRIDTISATTDSGLSARVTNVENAVATLDGKASAYVQTTAVAGNNRAQVTIHADANNGAGVDIVGDVSISGNLLVSGTVNTVQITGQAVNNIIIASDGGHSVGGGATYSSNGATITSTGGSIRIDYSVAMSKTANNGIAFCQLQRDMNGSTYVFGSAQYFAAVGGTAGAGAFSGFILDNIPAGTTARYYFYYNYNTATNGGAWNYEQVMVNEIKR